MGKVYRKSKSQDIPILIDLMFQLGYKHSEDSLRQNIEFVRSTGGEIFVCEFSGSVCACASAIIDTRLASGISGEIVSVVVNESYRGRGIGKGLIKHVEEWLKGRVPNIRIRANVVREEAHEFYISLGYSLSKKQAIFEKNLKGHS